MAHKLFIDNGYQATSIQDILDVSGIAKGTFYKYFSSKDDLLIAVVKSVFQKMDIERDNVLVGGDVSNIELFIKQYVVQLQIIEQNKLFTLFDEGIILNDPTFKQFIKTYQLKMLKWTFERFMQIFGKDKERYLLDCAIMFMGILHHHLKYSVMGRKKEIDKIVRYSVKRIDWILKELKETHEQLNEPKILDEWLPSDENAFQFRKNLRETVTNLKKDVCHDYDKEMLVELLDFIHDELSLASGIRKYIVSSTFTTLKQYRSRFDATNFERLETIIREAMFIEK